MPRVMQRSQLSKSVGESKAGDSPGSDQPLRISSARRFPSGVRAGSKPFGGSTMSVVCRCGVLGSVTPERSARPYSPFSICSRLRSPRPDAVAMRCFMRRLGRFVVLTAGLFAAATAVGGQARPRLYTTWTSYGGGAHSSQYSALKQINKSNVSQLQVVWTFPVSGTVIFNPLVIDSVMY